MTYERINFVDQSVERPRTYEMTYNSDGSVTLVDSFGLVDELGTPINADTMKHIEDGIAATAIRKYNANETFALNEWVLATVANETNFYKSLKDNNWGNPLTDTNYWEVVKIGGGGGLPIGTIIPVTASSSHVPENTLYCGEGTEFSGAEGQMFRNLWTDYILTGKLDTCTYSEYETELTMTGSCYKWAVDAANEKFRIPFIPDKVLTDFDDIIGVRGNGITLGLTNGTDEGGLTQFNYDGSTYLTALEANIGTGVGTAYVNNPMAIHKMIGVVPDTSKSGIEADAATAKTYKRIRHYVVVATGSINQSEADWSEFASSLASKANTDLSNTKPNASFRRDSVRWGIPDYSQQIEIEVVKGLNTYIAPYDGVIYGNMTVSTTKKYLTINGVNVQNFYTGSGTMSYPFYFQVYQGDIITLDYSSLSNNSHLSFAPFRE